MIFEVKPDRCRPTFLSVISDWLSLIAFERVWLGEFVGLVKSLTAGLPSDKTWWSVKTSATLQLLRRKMVPRGFLT